MSCKSMFYFYFCTAESPTRNLTYFERAKLLTEGGCSYVYIAKMGCSSVHFLKKWHQSRYIR